MKDKIGVLGGTFDPIHNGHLAIASYAIDLCHLDKVILIPTGMPPHKPTHGVMAPFHRYNMAKLATADSPFIEVSDMEITREGFSYTFDTITELREAMPDGEFYYIIGADNLSYIKEWKNAVELLKDLHIICFSREGYDMKDSINQLVEMYGAKLTVLSIPNVIISSSKIRAKLKNREEINMMLPDNVLDYIKANKLYTYEGD